MVVEIIFLYKMATLFLYVDSSITKDTPIRKALKRTTVLTIILCHMEYFKPVFKLYNTLTDQLVNQK